MNKTRIIRLFLLDTRNVLGSGKFLVFTLLAVLPSLIAFYVAGLFWIPRSPQLLRLLELMNPGSDAYSLLHDQYIETVKGLSFMVSGFWAGFPMLVVSALVASDFIAGERASGTFDLLATKPVHRYELVLSKLLVFVAASLPILLAVQALNVAVVAASFYSGLGISGVLDALRDAWRLIACYGLASWLYVVASSSLALIFSVKTKRSFMAAMGAIGYYIVLGMSAELVRALVSGRTGRMISELLQYADFSYHARVVLTQWTYGNLEALGERVVEASYPLSLTVMTLAPPLLVLVTLYVLERIDLT